jgi:homoaconitate hydratase
MGSREAFCYLASPAVVAASAAAGVITGTPEMMQRAARPIAVEVREAPKRARRSTGQAPILAGFPAQIEGGVLYLPKDNLNTDGIYGKEWTYQELPPEQMGEKAMLNYDPQFQVLVQRGDIVVGRQNFGTGSSREQAATALKYRGVAAIVAASFSQTYQRNAFNNGILLVESPELVEALHRLAVDASAPTLRMEGRAVIDFAESQIRFGGESYAMGPLSPAAQALVVAGGSEALVARRLQELAGSHR